MGYERYGRGDDRERDYGAREENFDYSRDDRANEDRQAYSHARDYRAAGWSGPGASDYGQRDYGRTDEQRGFGAPRSGSWGNHDDGRGENYSQRFAGGGDYYRSGQDYGGRDYARDPVRQARGTRNRTPQDYGDGRGGQPGDYRGDWRGDMRGDIRGGRGDDRGFLQRAEDEVRSWFGDEEAERRREADARRAEHDAGMRDHHYNSWRNQQIASFDRDYDEYRREHQSKFHNEFASWRTDRQGQRDLLGSVEEHADVMGSDGEHVGTVDKVRGDRIILTKSDADAGGHHHSVPSRWLQAVEGNTITLRKTAAEAKAHWRDEERQQGDRGAMFGRDGEQRPSNEGGATNLNRSFTGTY